MKSHLVLLGIISFVVVVTACVPGAEEPTAAVPGLEADRSAITETGRLLTSALDNDDLEGIMAFLTGDHITMAPNAPVLDDLVRVRGWHQQRISQSTLDIAFTSEELVVSGDWAFQRWRSTVTLTPMEGGDPTQDSGKGIWIWKRQADETWRLARSIWNSDHPVPKSP